MAMPEETGFLSRMRRLEELRASTKLVGAPLTEAFAKAEAKQEEERDTRSFAERFATQFLETYKEIQFRKGDYVPFATGLTITKVAELMEQDWFTAATTPEGSQIAVQWLFEDMERNDPAIKLT